MLLPPVFRSLESRVMVNIDAVYFLCLRSQEMLRAAQFGWIFFFFIFKLSKTLFVVNHYSLISLKDRGKYFVPNYESSNFYWRNGKKRELSDCAMLPAPKPHRRKCPLSLPCQLEDQRTLADPVRILLSPLIDMLDYWSSTAIRNVPHDWWIHNIQV